MLEMKKTDGRILENVSYNLYNMLFTYALLETYIPGSEWIFDQYMGLKPTQHCDEYNNRYLANVRD